MITASKRIAVVGAGIAGLTCAYELQKAGFEVTVYEKSERVGGRMSSRTKDGFIFDLGADHLCNLYDEMKRYCTEFGIPWKKMRFSKYGLSKGGAIVDLGTSVSMITRLKFALQYLRLPKVGSFFDLSELANDDNGNGYDYMLARVGKEGADYLVDAFTSTYQFHRASEISAGALLGILHSIKTDGEGWDLHRTQGGMQALPDAFAARLNVKTNQAIQHLTADQDTVTLTTVDGATETFDAAVLCSQANNSLALYSNPTPAQRTILAATQYASTISVAFRVPANLLGSHSVVWVPYVENTKISGFVNESMKGTELCHNNASLISVWLHEDFAKSLMNQSDETIYQAVKEEFIHACSWITSIEQLTNYDLERWPMAMPKFYPGYLKMVKEFMLHGQGAQNIFLCGDYLNAPWTEGALRNGQRVAKEITTKFS